MKRYNLSEEHYRTLKQAELAEMGGRLVLHDDSFSAEADDLKLLLLILNEEIVRRGMDKQDTVNEYGKKLYALYDELLAQK